jgi:NodT family efflux transporter outer membrane factor (OMF) lipoprotein
VKSRIYLVGIVASLGACTVGPNYRGPPTELTSSLNSALAVENSQDISNEPLPNHWWRLYDEPALDELIQRALASNRDLRAAEANLGLAAAIYDESRAARTPTTTFTGSAAYARDAIPTPTPSEFVYSVGGSIAYPVDFFGGIRRGIEAAKYGTEAAVAARDYTRVVVAAGVARAYVGACSANHSYAAAARVLAAQRRTFATTERLFQGGRATAFDVTRARAAVDQSAALLPGFIATRQSALYQLGALLGGPPADYPKDLEGCDTAPSLRNALPVGDVTELIRRRPDIRAAERSLAQATARIGVNVAKLYPQVSLGGAALSTAPFSLAGSEASLAFSVGPLITWSFPNQRIIRAQIAQASAAADAAVAKFDQTVIEALRQTQTSLSTYVREIDIVAAIQRTQADSADANAQAHRLYLFGRTDFINVLAAESNLATAEVALAQAQAVLVDDQIALFQALGGGWQV